ncbi:MAG: PrsW family intramembrane metalloprotease, partial [Lachnospiraceae bacterium]|nr:PrsW family intramembrane metalloprotease [Lachnospiraceae bacterium]
MVNLEYILFICVVAPLFLMLLMMPGRARLSLGFMIIGIVVCLFVSELNALLLPLFGYDMTYTTSVITPITEEIIKAIPILFYAKVFSDKRDTIMMISLALGIGFGMFENTVVLVQNIGAVTVTWAVIRGFSTALMHGICTLSVGFGISFI